MVDTTGFVTSLVINAVIAIVAFVLFLIWRPKYPWCYDTRRNPKRRIIGTEPPSQPEGMMAWLPKLVRLTDAEVMDTAGLDGVMFIKFFEICAQLFIGLTILGIAILLPVNFTAPTQYHVDKDSGETVKDVPDQFDQLSMANVAPKSDRFWAHLIIGYLFCFLYYYLQYNAWQDFLNLRHQFLAKWYSLGGGHTVLIHNLPEQIRSDKALFDYFNSLYPSQVRGARMAKDLSMEKSDECLQDNLTDTVVERAKVESALEGNIASYELLKNDATKKEEDKKRPLQATKCFVCAKVDAIDHNYNELQRLNGLISKKQQEIRASDAKTLLSGFVTFHSARTAQNAVHHQYNIQPYSFQVKPAPELRDVYWPSLNFTQTQRSARTMIFNVLTGLLIVFWMIPMAFLQGVSNLTELREKNSWLDGIKYIPTIILGFIEAYLPAIMLIVFFAVLPMILLAWSKAQGIEAHSWLQKSLFNKYFLFIIVNFFFGAILAGSVFSNIQLIIDDPTGIPTTLAQTIPGVANYFVNYVALAAFAGFPLQLAQVGRLIVGGILKKYVAVTPRDFEAAEAPPAFSYGTVYCNHLFVFIISITYSFISPIILPFAACYYTLGYIANKYQIVYVAVQPFESGGEFWPQVYGKMSACLLIAQITFVAILGLKQVPAEAVLVVPLPILTIIFDMYIKSAIKAKLTTLPQQQLLEIDLGRKHARRNSSVDAGKIEDPTRNGSPAPSTTVVTANNVPQNKDYIPTARLSLDEPSQVVIHAEPTEEKHNNGDVHSSESYLTNEPLDVDGTNMNSHVGFPYGPNDQNRAFVEGDIAVYEQPEITSLIPARIEVNRADQFLSENSVDSQKPLHSSVKGQKSYSSTAGDESERMTNVASDKV